MGQIMAYSGNIIADLIDEQREGELLVEVDCPDCEGSGKLKIENEDDSYQFIKFYETCIKCNDTGKILISENEARENAEIRAGELKEDR